MSFRRGITRLDEIKTWEQYYFENLNSPVSTAKFFPVDQEINRKISLWEGDITHLQIDAIVNAAKSSLLGGSGVDGAIHKAAGKSLKEECRELKGTPTGTAKITGGHALPATYIIHAVGPRNKDPNLLKSAYESSLSFTKSHPIRSIAFPCISTGVYGFPAVKAAGIAANVARQFLEKNKTKMDRIIFVVYGDEAREIYEKELPKYFPVQPSACPTESGRSMRPVSTPTRSSGSARLIFATPSSSESSISSIGPVTRTSGGPSTSWTAITPTCPIPTGRMVPYSRPRTSWTAITPTCPIPTGRMVPYSRPRTSWTAITPTCPIPTGRMVPYSRPSTLGGPIATRSTVPISTSGPITSEISIDTMTSPGGPGRGIVRVMRIRVSSFTSSRYRPY